MHVCHRSGVPGNADVDFFKVGFPKPEPALQDGAASLGSRSSVLAVWDLKVRVRACVCVPC